MLSLGLCTLLLGVVLSQMSFGGDSFNAGMQGMTLDSGYADGCTAQWTHARWVQEFADHRQLFPQGFLTTSWSDAKREQHFFNMLTPEESDEEDAEMEVEYDSTYAVERFHYGQSAVHNYGLMLQLSARRDEEDEDSMEDTSSAAASVASPCPPAEQSDHSTAELNRQVEAARAQNTKIHAAVDDPNLMVRRAALFVRTTHRLANALLPFVVAAVAV